MSLLLLTEARNARIDAVITLATGLALLASLLLLATPLSALAPITDPLGARGEPGLAARTVGGAAGCHGPGCG
ncbi:MAG: hypothetical protein VYC94_03530 [Cyanobacteriota bacterium]|nr:hypothetical protein [Cyanobacteriota bacterium]